MEEVKSRIAKIVIDRSLCIGAATCLVMAGEVFELDNENKAVIKRRNKANDSGPVIREELQEGITDEEIFAAAQSCPTKSIILYDENDKQIYP